MSSLIDQYLLFRLRTKRDPEAFAKLYDRYVVAIYRFVFLKVSSREKAEDLTSDTFLKTWEYLQKDVEIKNIRALFYQVARRTVIDHYRHDSIQRTSEEVVTFSEAHTSSDNERVFSDQARERQKIEASAEASLLLDRLSGLKEDFQDVLMLRLVNGLSFSDIAVVLEKTPGNVRVIYHRAMKALEETNP
ncbi:MAG: RNA polymerase sigma factor [Patescibacteria group bacterium]